MTALTLGSSVCCLSLAALLVGCGSAETANNASTGGASATTPAGGASTASSTGGTTPSSSAGGSTGKATGGTTGNTTSPASSGGSENTAAGGTSATATGPGIWAIINVDLTAASTDPPAEADAKISGFPKNAATIPENLKQTQESGVCKLYVPTNPFCEPKCTNTEKCRDTGQLDESGNAVGACKTSPVSVSMGNLAVKGLKLASGDTDEFSLSPINNTYESAGSTDLAYPPCSVGEEVTVSGGADDDTKFTVKATCIEELKVTSTAPVPFEASKKTTLTWTPPTVAGKSEIVARFDISHHGGLKGLILCEAPDTGSLEVDGELIKGLIQLGTAGYPVVRVVRTSSAEAAAGAGTATLNIQSTIELSLKVPGIDSCTTNQDCADSAAGKTCTARKCQ